VVHLHAVIRLDAATACACPAYVLPPPEEFTAALLEEAVKEAAATVAVACPPVDDHEGVTLMARWGEQLHIRHLTRDDGQGDKRLLAEQVAGYVTKDATKSTEGLGVTLDHRIGEAELEELDLPAHVAELDRACFELGSRRYSTTLTALRRPRASFAARRHESVELARQGLGETVEAATVLVLARWRASRRRGRQ
jgi:hypothetical protein